MITSFLRFIKKILLVLLCLSALIAGAIFAFENPQEISPVVVGYELPHLALGLYLAAAMMTGLLIGFVMSYWGSQSTRFKLKLENRNLKKQLKKSNETPGNSKPA